MDPSVHRREKENCERHRSSLELCFDKGTEVKLVLRKPVAYKMPVNR